jgi:hypothetical protein
MCKRLPVKDAVYSVETIFMARLGAAFLELLDADLDRMWLIPIV